MVAFCTLHASTMDPVTRDGLLELGFALPTVEEIRTAVFARPVSEGEGPRQLLLEEAWRTRESNRSPSDEDVVMVSSDDSPSL